MLRIALIGARRTISGCHQLVRSLNAPLPAAVAQQRLFMAMSRPADVTLIAPNQSLSTNPAILALAPLSCNHQQSRSVTKFSLKKGKRKTVKPVLKRFMRLDWGGWIRTRQGRHKKMWQKTGNLKRRLRQHVMVNATQAWLLDKMVTPFWRRPKHYVDDPYRPYHSREEYFATKKLPTKY